MRMLIRGLAICGGCLLFSFNVHAEKLTLEQVLQQVMVVLVLLLLRQ